MQNKEEKKFNTYFLFTVYGEGLSIAWHLENEGKNVLVGQVKDLEVIGVKKPESKNERVNRLDAYGNMLEKYSHTDLLKIMDKVEDKDSCFVIFDFNTMYKLADQVKKMGFTNGLFPSFFDYKLENDRSFAKEFVSNYYPDLKVAEVFEFSKIDEAIEHINNSNEFFALKGNDSDAPTVVPVTKIIEFAKEELIDALKSKQQEYERKGFILEKQIRDGVEFCLEQIFYDGELVCTTVDIENKAIGSGNYSIKTGCIQNLVCTVENDSPILSKIFPAAIQSIAKKHKGMFFADANTIFKDGSLYYLEHCGNRFGYDAIQTEIEMSGSASNFFESIANKKNPFKQKFGVAVRGLNLHQDENGSKGGLSMRWTPDIEEHIWPFEIKKTEEGKFINTASGQDLIVFTASSDDKDYAIIKAYEYIDEFSFDEMYFRPFHDFVDSSYTGNILERYSLVNMLISSEVDEEDNDEYEDNASEETENLGSAD